MFIAHATLSKE